MNNPLSTSLIVVAAGRGTRMFQNEHRGTRMFQNEYRGTRIGDSVRPKQYMHIDGEPLLAHTLRALLAYSGFTQVMCVIHPDDVALYEDCIAYLPENMRLRIAAPVMGGATRQESVYRGLQAMRIHPPSHVLIHDGARPRVSVALVERIIHALQVQKAARPHGVIPVLSITDTLKSINVDGEITATLPRETIVSVQTPQGFAYEAIWDVHHQANTQGFSGFTDDCALFEWHNVQAQPSLGKRITTVEGTKDNIKVTTSDDLHTVSQPVLYPRVGMGYDVHAFGAGDHVWLGGVKIPHTHGVVAHSDGDVVLHALTDALLGTIADGDIGTHFPPSDPQWSGVSSDQFLAHACRLVREAGGVIAHMDITLICETPKIGSWREAMVLRMREIANISHKSVSVKATTSEKLGFTGRKEGLAAHAVVTVYFSQMNKL